MGGAVPYVGIAVNACASWKPEPHARHTIQRHDAPPYKQDSIRSADDWPCESGNGSIWTLSILSCMFSDADRWAECGLVRSNIIHVSSNHIELCSSPRSSVQQTPFSLGSSIPFARSPKAAACTASVLVPHLGAVERYVILLQSQQTRWSGRWLPRITAISHAYDAAKAYSRTMMTPCRTILD